MNFGFKMAVAEMLKAFVNHTVKGSRRKHSKMEELQYYQNGKAWLSKSHAVNLAGEVISSLTLTSVVPRGMQSNKKNIKSNI